MPGTNRVVAVVSSMIVVGAIFRWLGPWALIALGVVFAIAGISLLRGTGS